MKIMGIFLGAMLASWWLMHPGIAAEPAAAYYPLKPGMVWEYTVVSSKAGTRKITIKNLEPKEVEGTKVTPREWHTGSGVRHILVAKDDFGVYRYGEQDPKDAKPVVTKPKVYYLREPVDRGTNWELVTKMGERPLKVSLTVESIHDAVTVPAGIFQDCVKIKHEGGGSEEGGRGFTLTAYEWYSPGAGLVKSLVTIKEGGNGDKPAETLTYTLDSLKR